MKIGIITKIGKNYGALLQAYALRKALELRGHSACIIGFELPITKKSYDLFQYKWGPRGTVENLKALLHASDINIATKRFLDFREKHLLLYGKYGSCDELAAIVPDFDLFITGSDQVWNPGISFNPAYYCAFCDDSTPKASYAASIGLPSIPSALEEEFIRRLSTMDYISVREYEARELLHSYGFDAQVACDPTLLLGREEWNAIKAEPSIPCEDYILAYFVARTPNAKDIVSEARRTFGLPVVNLMTSEDTSDIGDIQIRDAGPREFVSLFSNATFVVTSSFHGTAFSIINRTPFVSSIYSNTGSRVKTLLSSTGLSSRIVSNEKETAFVLRQDKELYTSDFEKNLDVLRASGFDALKSIEQLSKKR